MVEQGQDKRPPAVRIYGRWGSADGYTIRDFLHRCDVPFKWNWRLERDPFYLETNIPGVFSAGDVRYGSVKRCASAVGVGAMAVAFVHRYLENL
jgi:thioredoxin reductase